MNKLPIIAKTLKLNYFSWRNLKSHKPNTKYLLIDPKSKKQETVTIIGGLGDERIIAPFSYGKKSKLQKAHQTLSTVMKVLGIGGLTSIFSKVATSPDEQVD